ncbi:MAG: ABC transporter permease [Kiritimatiellia bacterium]
MSRANPQSGHAGCEPERDATGAKPAPPPASPIAATGPDPRHRTVIEARPGWAPLRLRELAEFHELMWFFLWRDLKGRYRQMALGPLWMVLQPLINTLLFTVLFSMVAKVPSDGLPYPLFTYSALLLWTFFSQCAESASGSLLGYRNLMAKVYFPRFLAPLVGVLAAAVEFLISFLILAGVFRAYGHPPGVSWLAVPLAVLPMAVLGLAVGLWAAPGVVHFRDVSQIVSFGLRALMYLSPVVYPSSVIPEKWRAVYNLNPLVGVLETWRGILFGQPVNLAALLPALGLGLLLLVSGAYVFRRAERNIVDVA